MNLDIVLIDYLTPDGILTTFRITPGQNSGKVTIEHLHNIENDVIFPDDYDIGGMRIYNSSNCLIVKHSVKLRSVIIDDSSFSFRFTHIGIPLNNYSKHNIGIYNFLLAPSWRLTKLKLYESDINGEIDCMNRKPLLCSVTWDPECNVQLISMPLGSETGSFSFIVTGQAILYNSEKECDYISSLMNTHSVALMAEHLRLEKDGKDILTKEIATLSDWLELKPKLFGIGIDLNKVIKYFIENFQKKIKEGIHL